MVLNTMFAHISGINFMKIAKPIAYKILKKILQTGLMCAIIAEGKESLLS